MNAICPIFVCEDVRRTLEFYVSILGFKYANHLEDVEKFATIYRDSIEIILIEKVKGKIETNSQKYGTGDDVYICPDTIESVDDLYNEFRNRGVKIVQKPTLKAYGSYEFEIEDIDGRYIGIGRVKNRMKYFEKSDYE